MNAPQGTKTRRIWFYWLQITDAKQQTVELRALASSADASKSWDLRCEIREKLIAFVQQNYPESLPRVRASVEGMQPVQAVA